MILVCISSSNAKLKATNTKEPTTKTTKSQTMIFGFSSDVISFVVTDPDNKKVGHDSINDIRYKEIPGANYYKEGIASPEDDEDPDLEENIRFSHMNSVKNGTYKIQVFGVKTGQYRLEFYTHDLDGFINGHHFFEGNIKKGEILNLSIKHSDQPKPYP